MKLRHSGGPRLSALAPAYVEYASSGAAVHYLSLGSLTQSAFTNGGTVVFGSHAVRWLVQEILENIGHVPKETIETCYRLEEPISLIYLNAFEAQGSDVSILKLNFSQLLLTT